MNLSITCSILISTNRYVGQIHGECYILFDGIIEDGFNVASPKRHSLTQCAIQYMWTPKCDFYIFIYKMNITCELGTLNFILPLHVHVHVPGKQPRIRV